MICKGVCTHFGQFIFGVKISQRTKRSKHFFKRLCDVNCLFCYFSYLSIELLSCSVFLFTKKVYFVFLRDPDAPNAPKLCFFFVQEQCHSASNKEFGERSFFLNAVSFEGVHPLN